MDNTHGQMGIYSKEMVTAKVEMLKIFFLISETKIQWVNRKLNTTEERIP